MDKKTLFLAMLVLEIRVCLSTDPTLSQSTLTDTTGNTANADSTVTFASLSTVKLYKTTNTLHSKTGMEWYYSLQTIMIDSLVFPNGFPSEIVEGLFDGTVTAELTTGYSGLSYFSNFLGYVVMIVIGFIFVVLFPLIGCCICCCRCCCGNCGGESYQSKEDADNKCRRRTYIVFLFVMILFICFGMICLYITNLNISNAVDKLDSSISDNLDDFETYVDLMVTQVKQIGQINFNFTRDVIYRDLDSIGYLLGIPVRTTLETNSGLTASLASVLTLSNRISSISTALTDVNTKVTAVQTAASEFTTAMNVLTTVVDETSGKCTCTGPTMSNYALLLNTGNFPSLTTQTSQISTLSGTDFTALTEAAKTDLNNVPERVQNETTSTVANVKSTVSNFTDKVNPMVTKIEDAQKLMKDNFLTKARTYINTTDYQSFDNYRYLGGIGIASLVLLIVVLMLLGLMFSLCGHEDVKPTERGCLSSCGGHFLMASVVFVFLLSWLLMLLTILTFSLGSPLKRFVCEPFTDTPYATQMSNILDTTIFKAIYGNDSGSYVGSIVLDNSTANITLSGVLEECYNDTGAYSAFKLEDMINITELTDYKSSITLDTELNNINVDLSSVVVLTSDLESKLDDFKSAVTISFTSFYDEINGGAMANSIDTLISELDALNTEPTYGGEFTSHSTQATNIKNNQLAALETAMANLNTSVAALETAVSGVDTTVDDVKTALNDTQNYLQVNGTTAIKTEASTFANRLYKVVDYFVNDTVDALNNELGACRPVYNLYNSIVRISLCSYIVDSLNGFWFSLGMCIFFFIPSIIFATKLARHFRRMDQTDADPEPVVEETVVKKKIEVIEETSEDEEERERERNILMRENVFYRRFLQSKRIADPLGNFMTALGMRGKNKVNPDFEQPPPYTVAPPRVNAFTIEKKGAAW